MHRLMEKIGAIIRSFPHIYMRGDPTISSVMSSRALESLKQQYGRPMQSDIAYVGCLLGSSRLSTLPILLLNPEYQPKSIRAHDCVLSYLLSTERLSK
jgi:hypothetical protein